MTIKQAITGIILILCTMTAQAKIELADSIIRRMHEAAAEYGDFVQEYHANLYIKTQLDIIKKNRGFRYIPGLFRGKKDQNRYIMETYSDLHFTAPHIYDQKIKAFSGTLDDSRNIPGTLDYFNLNVYAPYLLGEKLLSPLAPNSNRYYIYYIDSVSCDSQQRIEYHIHFTPRNKSFQLIEGTLVITEGVWSVRRIIFKGKSEFLSFNCDIVMGKIGEKDEYLPVKYNMDASFGLAFNVVDGYYEATLIYHDVTTKKDSILQKRKTNYNLTASFSLQCDTQAYLKGYRMFDSLRTEPLTSAERLIYQKARKSQDTIKATTESMPKFFSRKQLWNSVSDFFFDSNKWYLSDNLSLSSSPFINPFLISYSKSNGIAYRQDIKFNTMLKNERSIYAGARIGYNFTNKEFYWNIGSEYIYWPEHRGSLHFNMGNGNRIGSSRILDELKKLPTDSILDVKKLNLELFTDFNVEISNHFEIVNGLTLHTGIIFHRRTPIEKPDIPFYNLNLPKDLSEGLRSSVRTQYSTFAPRIKIEWTPRQYYYMNGRQKINIGSQLPTFILDYERGLRNIFNCTGVYERIEFDMQHHIKTGLLSNLYYRFGMGFFTNMEETYFVDFVNFRKSNLPNGWSDEIGGVFQALDGEWYNVSPYYIRGHIVFEAPFLLMRHLMKYTSHIQNERIYVNMLTMDHLGPYFEFGYGIGTFVFDAGVFLSLEQLKNVGLGFKITFELFN